MYKNKLIPTMFIFAAAMALATPSTAASQGYPTRPVKIIVPFPAGSSADASTRLVGAELAKRLGQPFVVETMPGADGIIGAEAAKRAAPDGYTIFLSTNSTHAANLSLYNKLPYDPQKDFTAIAGLVSVPMIMLVKNDFPAQDVAGFLKIAQQQAASEKPLNYGSGNTAGQVAGALLGTSTKINFTHVPYKGSPQALQDLAGGILDFLFTDAYSPLTLVHGGRLKVLGVADQERHPLYPQVPTMAEAGLPEVQVVAWNGFFAPAKTDPAIIARLNEEINEILSMPHIAETLQTMALTPMKMTPAELDSLVSSEIARWRSNITLAGITKK
ncbi:tripartite tricarboxylate transporter substrate binding protein [Verticiella sediminum]|uniref:Tripartite tricarboxylate transporter substrate binding protein n=1 Tax=Verticiella sediminum TaxID=1247510 RepID=A0A556AV12_9BURK|nr:tripartite tricarboxylate transporter substrate binding protein [Verticiella sediminum]TSH96777.1 tripartite tricarboxylate transporter substrate binding protein [Verticiella sediminum]